MNIDQEIQNYKNELKQLENQKMDLEKQIIIQEERMRSLKELLLSEYGTNDEVQLLKIKENLEKEIFDLKKTIEEQ